jgi:hypothetical protein
MLNILIFFYKNTIKEKCLSYLDPPTENPQVAPSLDHGENLARHMRSHQSSRSGAPANQKMYHYI